MQCERCGCSIAAKRKYCSSDCYFARIAVPPKDELEGLYDSGMSAPMLALHYDVSSSTIYSWLHEHRIPLRSIAEAVSLAHTGASRSPEHCAAIAKGQLQRYADRPHERCCELCGTRFELLYPSSPKKYCGRQCAATVRARAWGKGSRRSRQGKREALGGLFVRSSWENNFALILNEWVAEGRIARWEYEPQLFEFVGIKRGSRFYLPDFKVYLDDGTHSFYEVKGWMDAASKTKLARFAKYYPDERLVLVDKPAYMALVAEYKTRNIPGWES